MAVYGLYYALTQPVLKALVVDTVGETVRGRALGIYFFVTSVATLAASLITGQLWKHYGAGIPFYFSAAVALVAAGMLQFSRRSASPNLLLKRQFPSGAKALTKGKTLSQRWKRCATCATQTAAPKRCAAKSVAQQKSCVAKSVVPPIAPTKSIRLSELKPRRCGDLSATERSTTGLRYRRRYREPHLASVRCERE